MGNAVAGRRLATWATPGRDGEPAATLPFQADEMEAGNHRAV